MAVPSINREGLGVDLFCQRHDIVVNQGAREERRRERRDGGDDDANQYNADAELIVAEHVFRQSPDDGTLLGINLLDASLVLGVRATRASVEAGLSHAAPPFSFLFGASKSPQSASCMAQIS